MSRRTSGAMSAATSLGPAVAGDGGNQLAHLFALADARPPSPPPRPPPSPSPSTPSPALLNVVVAIEHAGSRTTDPGFHSIPAQAQAYRTRKTKPTMSELLSLSVFQLLSILSFLTSLLAVFRVGAGSFNRISHYLDGDVTHQTPHIGIGSGKSQLWNWTGLPVSFSLGALIGEDEHEEDKHAVGGYVGGGELMRMNWQIGRQRPLLQTYDARQPASMAKLIMTRHVSAISCDPNARELTASLAFPVVLSNRRSAKPTACQNGTPQDRPVQRHHHDWLNPPCKYSCAFAHVRRYPYETPPHVTHVIMTHM
ncbi:hypothetical protein CERSUDRAFT_114791 [Gelatoporia subvermispora B]|uniref:Uncharacterized protein n=1 Tax=Ceriporiopsis subvermispora (strain B) TaxID=914234 RepID=M2QIL4_CERS8|nr:hypothetical protein CERSUDRAFT_114791 [Gelatoporia subvermispora B]